MLERFLKHDENKIVMIVHRKEEIKNYLFLFFKRLIMILFFIIVAIISE